jgi:hypothetical protein
MKPAIISQLKPTIKSYQKGYVLRNCGNEATVSCTETYCVSVQIGSVLKKVWKHPNGLAKRPHQSLDGVDDKYQH